MRGRTNAESGNGVILNGTIDTYEVASGETILAGDFVERYAYVTNSLTSASSYLDAEVKDKSPKIYEMSDGDYLQIGGKTNLYNTDNDVITKEWSEKSTPIIESDFNILLDDDTILGEFTGVNQSSIPAPVIQCSAMKYDSANKTVTKKTIIGNTITGAPTSLALTRGILFYKISDRTYRVFVEKTDSEQSSAYSRSYCLYTFILEITGNSYDNYALSCSNLVVKRYSDDNTFNFSPSYFTIKKIENDFYIRLDSQRFIKFSNNAFSNYVTISGISFIESSDAFLSTYIINHDDTSGNVDFFTHYNYTSSGKSYSYLYINRMYLDMDNADCNIYTKRTICGGQNYLINIRRVKEDNNFYYFLLREYITGSGSPSTSSLSIVKVDKVTGEHTVSEKTDIPEKSTTILLSEIDNNTLWLIGSNLYIFDVSDGYLVDKSEQVKQVRGITSQNYIKGVAKQSGSAGDTIQVYVPTVNS